MTRYDIAVPNSTTTTIEQTRAAVQSVPRFLDGLRRNHQNLRLASRVFDEIRVQAGQVREQCQLAARYNVIVAVDFCEIVDYAYPYAAAARDASVLEGTMVSRLMIDALCGGRRQFTLLPATLREIEAFLRIGQGRFRRALGADPWQYSKGDTSQLLNVLSEPEISRYERVAATVIKLITSPSFVNPASLSIDRDSRRGEVNQFREQLKRLRPNKDIPNDADARNLQIIASANREAASSKQARPTVMQLVTRTGVLHRLTADVEAQTTVSIRQELDDANVDLVLHPKVLLLWNMCGRQSPNNIYAQHEVALGVEVVAADIARALSALAFRTQDAEQSQAVRQDNEMHILASLTQVREAVRKPQYRQLAEYRRLCETDSEYSIQAGESHHLLKAYARSDSRRPGALREHLDEERRRIAAMRTQEMLIRAFDSIKLLSGGLAETSLVAKQSAARGAGVPPRAATSIFRGRQVYKNHPTEGAVTWFVPRRGWAQRAEPQEDIEQRGIFGVTEYKSGRRTVFWTPRISQPSILDSIQNAGGMAPVCSLVAVTVEGKAVGSLEPGHAIRETLERLGGLPAKAVQIEMADGTSFTWEAGGYDPDRPRPAFCSVRGPTGTLATWLEALKKSLPIEHTEAGQIMMWGLY